MPNKEAVHVVVMNDEAEKTKDPDFFEWLDCILAAVDEKLKEEEETAKGDNNA